MASGQLSVGFTQFEFSFAGILVRDTLVEYDRANKQIGFWRTNCTELWTSLQDAYDGKSPPIESSPTPKNESKNPPTEEPIAAPAPIQIPGKNYDHLNLYRELNLFFFCFIKPAQLHMVTCLVH